MVSCPVSTGSVSAPLNFKIIFFPGGICSVSDETDRTGAAEPLEIFLRFETCYCQVRDFRYNAENEFSERNIIPEETSEKVVINRAQASESRQISLPVAGFF